MAPQLTVKTDDRKPCITSVYPDREDYNSKKGLNELILDFEDCEEKRSALLQKIDLYNAEQKQKQEASKLQADSKQPSNGE